MRTTLLFLGICLLLCPVAQGQNYFTGELFEAYEWDLKTINDLELELEDDITLRRRMLSKKEKTLGDRIKVNKQFFDQVVIKRKSDLEVNRIKENLLEIQFSKNSEFTLLFGPDDRDGENYVVVVKEMKGHKGVTEYSGKPFRVLNGSRLIIGKLKKKKLPPARTSKSTSKWKGNGTAVLIDTRGYLITNHHVVEDADEIVVRSAQLADKDFSAKVVMRDKANDLALLKISDKYFKAPSKKIPFNLSSEVQDVGTKVFTLGYPLALSSMGQEVKFADGSISAKTGYEDDISMYQVSVPVQPGNSGGPLFDLEGNLVGIVSGKVVGTAIDNVSYAVKSSYAKALIESAKNDVTVPSGTISGSVKFLIKQLDDFVFLVKVD